MHQQKWTSKFLIYLEVFPGNTYGSGCIPDQSFTIICFTGNNDKEGEVEIALVLPCDCEFMCIYSDYKNKQFKCYCPPNHVLAEDKLHCIGPGKLLCFYLFPALFHSAVDFSLDSGVWPSFVTCAQTIVSNAPSFKWHHHNLRNVASYSLKSSQTY